MGRNVVTSVALAQHFIDQGLCEVTLILYLENCHGKWISDSLFGQAQTRLDRTTVVSVDGLLNLFEAVMRKDGGTSTGHAINPLACINFVSALSSLGYEVSPHPDLRWEDRNVHCVASFTPSGRENLSPELSRCVGDLLPTEEGMVRLSFTPPDGKSMDTRIFEERSIDVPAARVRRNVHSNGAELGSSSMVARRPFLVALDQPYAASVGGVVSHSLAVAVGHNGWHFRHKRGTAELTSLSSDLARHAWPGDMHKRTVREPVPESGIRKVAPSAWIARRTVQSILKDIGRLVSRYQPVNLCNAIRRQGPRDLAGCVAATSFEKPPFPLIEGTCAYVAMQRFRDWVKKQGPFATISMLDCLRFVFAEMGDRRSNCDEYVQNRATEPSLEALEEYRVKLRQSRSRRRGYPVGIRTVKQFFKSNAAVKDRVNRIISAGDTRTKPMIFDDLYVQAKADELLKFKDMVEEDEKRFANELETFKERQKQFDQANGLAPVTPPHS